jgi:hypothetical protein
MKIKNFVLILALTCIPFNSIKPSIKLAIIASAVCFYKALTNGYQTYSIKHSPLIDNQFIPQTKGAVFLGNQNINVEGENSPWYFNAMTLNIDEKGCVQNPLNKDFRAQGTVVENNDIEAARQQYGLGIKSRIAVIANHVHVLTPTIADNESAQETFKQLMNTKNKAQIIEYINETNKTIKAARYNGFCHYASPTHEQVKQEQAKPYKRATLLWALGAGGSAGIAGWLYYKSSQS